MSDDTILLIEDSRTGPGPAALALERLRNRPYTATHASTLADGIEHVGRTRFAAVILDMTVRDGMGLPAFLRFQSKAGTVPIIVLIDSAYEDLGVGATRRGALDYVLKDEVSGALLEKVLRRALGRTHSVLALRASGA